uniref:NTR domain-containing protein n=1 Tax=Strigamia maritima TaxID=126957 RepID=T1JKL0_STRMM
MKLLAPRHHVMGECCTSYTIMYFALALVFLLSVCKSLDACTCLPAHPQTHYCKSDYVLLVKVKHSKIVPSTYGDAQMIHVKVKKTFKESKKSKLALKRGQMWSAKDDGLCGVDLRPNVKYLVTGRVDAGKAFISSCNYYQEWSKLTTKQKKGFRLLYQQGCECK